MIHVRLKDELDRLGLKPAAASKAVGEPDSQGLRDVLGGRKRLSADLLAALAEIGCDALYILTGQRTAAVPPAPPLKPDEAALLDNYRHTPEPQQRLLRETSAALAQHPRKGKRSA